MKTPVTTKILSTAMLLACIAALSGCPFVRKAPVRFDPEALTPPKAIAKLDTSSTLRCTFTGEVVSVDDGAGAAAAANVQVGDPVEYKVDISLSADGFVVTNNSDTIFMTDATELDYFRAQAVSGWLIGLVDAGFYNQPANLADMQFGLNMLDAAPGTFDTPKGRLVMGSNNHSLVMSNVDLTVDLWDFFTAAGASEEVHDATGNTTTVLSWLSLTAIDGQPTPPVPTPDPPDPPAGTMLYTFTGAVSLVVDGAGAAAAAGLNVGSQVTYQVAVNLNEQGYVMTRRGDVVERVDALPTLDYFFAQVQGNTPLDPVNGGYHTGLNDLASLGIGLNLGLPVGTLKNPKGRMWLGDADDRIAIISTSLPVTTWAVGMTFPAVEEAFDDVGSMTQMFSNLQLVSIQALP